MRPHSSTSLTAEAAAFALFEGLRASEGLPLDRLESCRLTCLRAVDPAVEGLAWTNTGDAALRLHLDDAPAGLGESLWLHAACDARGPYLSVYLSPERPILQARFAAPAYLPLEDHRFLLRERLIFSSHDGWQDERKALAESLARRWRVPLMGGWLHVGAWDALQGAWQPEAARRLVAAALVIELARRARF